MLLGMHQDVTKGLGLIHEFRAGTNAAAPVLLALHGRGGTAQAMSFFAAQAPAAWHVLAPQAPDPEDTGGYRWWPVSPQTLQAETPEVQRAAERLVEFIAAARREYHLEKNPLIGCGFSQGGALLSLLVQQQPALLAGAALLCSYVFELLPYAVMGSMPVLMVHGARDPIIPLALAERGAAWLEERGADLVFVKDASGHKVGTAGVQALREWLTKIRLR